MPTQSETYYIPALDCPDEFRRIRSGLEGRPGIEALEPDYLSRTLRIHFDSRHVDPWQLAGVLRRLGFQAELTRDRREIQTASRISVWPSAWTLVGGILLFSAATGRWILGMDVLWVDAAAIASTIISGAPIVRAALTAAFARALDMNALMSIAAIGAIATGELFEAATTMFLFGIALWLERISAEHATREVRSLVTLTPTVAHRMVPAQPRGPGPPPSREQRPAVGQPETPGRSDAPADIPGDWVIADGDPAELKVGDHVLAKPGERIPIDGVVLSGTTSVNQAPITGESLPVEKLPGDPVFAGTLNGEGSLIIRATRTADESTLAHIARLVREAQSSRSPTQRLVDRFAQHYTPAVIALAVLIAVVPPLLANVGVAWAASVSPWQWIHRGLVLLVIACPCALVLSTPVTIVCGVYAAARRGVLIKGGEHLEAAAEIECMAFDKTGTLTRGVPEVVHVDPVSGHSADEVLRIAAALEQHSEHPLAAAIVRAADERFLGRLPVEEFQALRGLGVEGTVNGVRCLVGNARLMQQRDISVRDGNAGGPLPAGRGDLAITKAVVAANGRQLGNVWLADRLRAGAAEAIGQLRQLGVSPIWMLTGDHPDVARPIGEQLGVDEVFGHLLPADKVKRVRELAESHPHLAMVGDGVNDAPALAEAFVGIALGAQSSDTALETADVVLMSPQPGRLPELIRLGRDCRRLLAQNIAFSLGIKGAVLCLAALGWATMWVAVASDVGASLIVIANGTRILRNGRRGLLPLCFAP